MQSKAVLQWLPPNWDHPLDLERLDSVQVQTGPEDTADWWRFSIERHK